MPIFVADKIRRMGLSILQRLGVRERDAECVIEHLVESDLMGHSSHGIILLPIYTKMIKDGKIDIHAKPRILKETSTTAILDGKWHFGQVSARMAMDIAIKKAKEAHLGAVGIIHCNHIGRLGAYSQMAINRDLIGIVMCNSGPKGGCVVPFGGKESRLSTNPISVGVPAGKMKPFLMDFATSTVAFGKLRILKNQGKTIPKGWVLNKYGEPTINPEDAFNGGMLITFGGHKGYALSLLIDILGGALTGAGCTSSDEYEDGNGTFILTINPKGFGSTEKFMKRIDELFTNIKETPTLQGFDRVLIPGELEFEIKEKRLKKGIPIDEVSWRQITELAEELSLDIDRILYG